MKNQICTILGGGGFIGRYLVRNLTKKNYRCIISTRNAFQKVRELTATTTSSKLKALGGETEKIGMKLFQEIDSPVSKFSASGIAERLKLDYSNRAFALVQGANANEQAAAIRIVRGSKEKRRTVYRFAKRNLFRRKTCLFNARCSNCNYCSRS